MVWRLLETYQAQCKSCYRLESDYRNLVRRKEKKNVVTVQVLRLRCVLFRPATAGNSHGAGEIGGFRHVNGVDFMNDPGKTNMADGHSVSLVGYAKSPDFPRGGFFVFRNSWVTDLREWKYGYSSFDYVKKHANDLLVYQAPAN